MPTTLLAMEKSQVWEGVWLMEWFMLAIAMFIALKIVFR